MQQEYSRDLTMVTREDGGKQWAIDDKPLYTFVQDKKPGDVTRVGRMVSGMSSKRSSDPTSRSDRMAHQWAQSVIA
jgi:hypothetical protein